MSILEGLGEAMDKAIPVVVACAAAGIIYGAISATGVGFKISSVLVAMAGGSKFMVMVLSGFSAILLGFAIPPTASYVIMAALIVPLLLEIGLVPIAAHMFLFIFCCIGPITPPVALAAYSAAGIADSPPNKTGYTAFMMGLAAFVIPFFFAYNPHLLFVGSTLKVISSTFLALVSLALLVVAVEGFFLKKLTMVIRGALMFACFLVFYVGVQFY